MRAQGFRQQTDQVSRGIVAGFSAMAVLFAVYLVGYAVAHLLALVPPSATLSHRAIAGWLHNLTQMRLADPAEPAFVVALALQAGVGLAAAVAYAAWVAPRVRAPEWLGGLLCGLVSWLGMMLLVLPALGAGVFGAALGAGPLLAALALLAHLAYGVALGVVYTPREDMVVTPAEAAAGLAGTGGWARSAIGIAAGFGAGVLLGLALGLLVPWQSDLMASDLAPPVLALASGLLGAGLGALAGTLSALPTAPAQVLAARLTARPVASTVAEGRVLRVVAAHGRCQLGYAVGQTFRCTRAGTLEPEVCSIAQEALQPLLQAIAAGRPDAPQRVACPIYDHMLVFEVAGAR